MSHPCCGGSGGEDLRPIEEGLSPSDRLALAASPTFLAMALATFAVGSDQAPLLCSSGPGGWLGGMGAMYLLMGLFHAPPWLRWLRTRMA